MAQTRMMRFGRMVLFAHLAALFACASGSPKTQESAQKGIEPTEAPRIAPTRQQPVDVPSEMVLVPQTEVGFARPEDVGAKPVVLIKAFLIDKLEATVAEYLACRDSGACTSAIVRMPHCNASAKSPRLDHPINCISWHEAQRYCAFKNKRLPTAAEWELAARGRDQRHYPWGNELPVHQLCWQGKKKKGSQTTCPVGTHPDGASPYGVLDMAGNVAEWTATILEGVYPQPAYDTRGGGYSWEQLDQLSPDDTSVRADGEGGMSASASDPMVGVRCARSLSDSLR